MLLSSNRINPHGRLDYRANVCLSPIGGNVGWRAAQWNQGRWCPLYARRRCFKRDRMRRSPRLVTSRGLAENVVVRPKGTRWSARLTWCVCGTSASNCQNRRCRLPAFKRLLCKIENPEMAEARSDCNVIAHPPPHSWGNHCLDDPGAQRPSSGSTFRSCCKKRSRTVMWLLGRPKVSITTRV